MSTRRRWVWPLVIAVVLVVALAALGCFVIWSETRYVVHIGNDSDVVWQGLVLAGGGIEREIGDLPPRSSVDVGVWFDRDGSVVIRESGPDPGAEHLVDGYVTNGFGGFAEVVRGRDGTVSVTLRSR